MLLVVGGMNVASADNVTIYFQPNNNWKNDNAVFYVWAFGAEDATQFPDSWIALTADNSLGTDIYKAEINTNYKKMLFARLNPNGNSNPNWDNKWNQTWDVDNIGSYLYTVTNETEYNTIKNYDYTTKYYLPWNYYFIGNFSNDNFTAGPALLNNGDNYVGTLSGKSGKHFLVAKGEYITNDGYLDGGNNNENWGKVIRPIESKTINFESFTESTTTTNNNQNWLIGSDIDNVIVSVNIKNNTYSVNCTKSMQIGNAGYATYSNGEKFSIDGAKVYTISANNTSSVTMTEQAEGTIYPAATGSGRADGFILKANSGSTVTIHAVAADATTTVSGANLLNGSGNSSRNVTATDNTYVFNWKNSDPSTVGFYKASGNGTLDAHKAYLDVSGANAREFLSFDFDGETTGISTMSSVQNDGIIYNLQGIRQSQLQKGLNIVNGKKVLVK